METYFSFVKEPPGSIAIKTTTFKTDPTNGGGYWEIPPGDPFRMPLKQPIPPQR
jgi:hypothetical protein